MNVTQAASRSVGDRVVHKAFAPITRHTLALYCGASGDHNPIHVDLDFAKKAGFPEPDLLNTTRRPQGAAKYLLSFTSTCLSGMENMRIDFMICTG